MLDKFWMYSADFQQHHSHYFIPKNNCLSTKWWILVVAKKKKSKIYIKLFHCRIDPLGFVLVYWIKLHHSWSKMKMVPRKLIALSIVSKFCALSAFTLKLYVLISGLCIAKHLNKPLFQFHLLLIFILN